MLTVPTLAAGSAAMVQLSSPECWASEARRPYPIPASREGSHWLQTHKHKSRACCFCGWGGAEYKIPPSWIHPKTLSANGSPREPQEGCVQRTRALTCSSVWKKNFCGHCEQS